MYESIAVCVDAAGRGRNLLQVGVYIMAGGQLAFYAYSGGEAENTVPSQGHEGCWI